jgi:hypothetical protein
MVILVRLLVWMFTVFLLFVGLSGLLGLCLGWESSLGQVSRLLLEARRSAALVQRKKNIDQAMKMRKAIIVELLAYRLTLRESAGLFREANELAKEGDNELMASYQSPTTEVELCRQVLFWVRTKRRFEPEHVSPVLLAQLEQDFAEIISTHGPPSGLTLYPLSLIEQAITNVE